MWVQKLSRVEIYKLITYRQKGFAKDEEGLQKTKTLKALNDNRWSQMEKEKHINGENAILVYIHFGFLDKRGLYF